MVEERLKACPTEAQIAAGMRVLDAWDSPSIRPNEAGEMLAAVYEAMRALEPTPADDATVERVKTLEALAGRS